MENTKTPKRWSLEHLILNNSIYGGGLGRRLYEMDKEIAEKIIHDMEVERELLKHGHLGNKQTKRK